MERIEIPEEKILQLAEKYALEGAKKAIREYYTSYSSPYVKAVTEYVRKLGLSPHFDIPDFTAAINQAIMNRVTEMCNEAISKTYLPILNRILSGYDGDTVRSQSLYQVFGDYVKDVEGDDFDSEELEIKVEDRCHGFAYIYLIYQGEEKFRVSLMKHSTCPDGTVLWVVTGLPGSSIYEPRVNNCRYMRIKLDDGKALETPILDDVLSNDVLAWLANIMINKVKMVISSYHHYDEEED